MSGDNAAPAAALMAADGCEAAPAEQGGPSGADQSALAAEQPTAEQPAADDPPSFQLPEGVDW